MLSMLFSWRALRALLGSTDVTNVECATCSGPTRRRAFGDAFGTFAANLAQWGKTLFAPERLSPSAREQQFSACLGSRQVTGCIDTEFSVNPASRARWPAGLGQAARLQAGARSADADGRLTRTGTVLGTPAYMFPEQAAGESAVDARADFDGLGAVAIFAPAGRRLAPRAIRGFEPDNVGRFLARGSLVSVPLVLGITPPPGAHSSGGALYHDPVPAPEEAK
jgi:hypothetical protein